MVIGGITGGARDGGEFVGTGVVPFKACSTVSDCCRLLRKEKRASRVGASMPNSLVPIFTAREVCRRDEPLAAPVGVKIGFGRFVRGGMTPWRPLLGPTLTTMALLWIRSRTGSASSMFVWSVRRSVTILLNWIVVRLVGGTTVFVNGT